MDIARLVLDYVRALAWPTVVIVACFMFRREFTGILNRLSRASLPGGLSLDFGREVRAAEKLSREVEKQERPAEKDAVPMIPLTEANARMLSLGLQPSPSGLDFSQYRDLASQDPNLALAGLRMEVETLTRNLAKGFGIPHRFVQNTLRNLYERGNITTEQYQLAQKVVRLCNAAVHGAVVSRKDAESVIDAASVLAKDYIAWLSWGFPNSRRDT